MLLTLLIYKGVFLKGKNMAINVNGNNYQPQQAERRNQNYSSNPYYVANMPTNRFARQPHEGITEALLLPIFAKLLDKKENVEKYNLEKNGIEIIVTGTSFQRYSGLFNSDNEKERLNIKCAVLTDDDKDKEDLSDGRLKNLEELSKNNFKVFLGKNTFEWELFNNNLENDIITKVFDGIHPKIRKSLINEGKEFNPDILVEKLSKNKTKSDFSFELAKYLENNSEEIEEFNIPEYIKKAIYYVTGEDYDN